LLIFLLFILFFNFFLFQIEEELLKLKRQFDEALKQANEFQKQQVISHKNTYK